MPSLILSEAPARAEPQALPIVPPVPSREPQIVAFATSAAPASSSQLEAAPEPTRHQIEAKLDSVASPAEARRAAAEAFFLAEQAENAKRLLGLVTALGLDAAAVEPLCASQRAALDAPKPDGMVTIRLCRAHAYSAGERRDMYRLDRALSDLGDQDAESRLTRHLLLGHDRLPERAPQAAAL